MYNNLSLYRDNGLKKQAYQVPGTIKVGDPNNPSIDSRTSPFGNNPFEPGVSHSTLPQGHPFASNTPSTINLDEVGSGYFDIGGVSGTHSQAGAQVHQVQPSAQSNPLTSTPTSTNPNPQSTSYTSLPPQTPQLRAAQPGTYTLPQQGSPLTLQGTQDAATGQPVQSSTYVTPEGSFGAYGLDQAMKNPNSLTMTHVNEDPLGYHFGPDIGMQEIMDDNYSPTLGWLPSVPRSKPQEQPQTPTDIFTSDHMLNNIAPSGAWGLGIGALAGALGGGNPVKTGLGAGVGAFGGKMLYDYLANNKDTKQYIQQFQDWASKNLWDGAGEHVQYLAPILGGLAGFAATN